MISAILMAGYNNKRAVKKYSRIVAENYGQTFIETGYKPLREFKTVKDGGEESKPLIQYTLEELLSCDAIEDIVIVGHKMLLEQRLGSFIKQHDKPCKIVNQNSKIPQDVIAYFNIMEKKVRFNSIAGNLVKGYVASGAFLNKKHALFVAADSPFTTEQFMERFLNAVKEYQKKPALIFPIVGIDDIRDKLGRYPVRLLNDSPYHISDATDHYGRLGFRLSSLVFLNPHLFNLNTVNTAYSLRKLLNPRAQLRLFRITRGLGYPNVYAKYFIKKDLSITEVENITSKFFEGKVKLIPMIGEETTYDYDGTDFEYLMITEMLNTG